MGFNDILKDKVKDIDTVLNEYLPACTGRQKQVLDAMDYSVRAGGKRIRPLILSETYRLCGGTDFDSIAPFMAALEFIHTYSLVHDDLPAMDNDDYRRGQLTTHKKYGEDIAILCGDALLNYAYEVMINAACECRELSMSQRMVKAANIIAQKAGIYGMVGGQTLDVWLTDKDMSKEDLEFIFDLKTGALIEAAFMAGAMLAGADEIQIQNLRKAGNLVGVAFQIKDDILDVTSTQDVLGKPVFSDKKNNKTTYVTLYGMDKALSDVERMSEAAIEIVKQTGDNEFLEKLIYKLINREK